MCAMCDVRIRCNQYLLVDRARLVWRVCAYVYDVSRVGESVCAMGLWGRRLFVWMDSVE